MRFHAAWACAGWLLLGLLHVAHCDSIDNVLSHARERIWLWEMYDIFCEIEGADKQSMILGQNKKAQWYNKRHFSLENTVDGKLTYAEFQADMEKKLKPMYVDKSLKAPRADGFGNPTVAEAADALKKKGWAMKMDVSQITSGVSNDYVQLIGRVNKKFQDYYDTLGSDPKWKRKLIEANMRTHTLSKEIVALRRQEADEWLLKQMTRSVDPPGTPDADKAYGLGLDRKDLVIETLESPVPGAGKWERVDFGQTIMNHPDLEAFKKKLADAGIKGGVQGLINWADNLGNEMFASHGPGYTNQNKSHAQAQVAWDDAHSSAERRLGGLSESCSR
ncbi:hypothetical protein FHETE_6816 [Fusarium heterosporum]|uniref:EF-hand domain-containing protein n=1 Tax=Fusarium heterosporum TaxID=42747 RepID=A0A8H5T8G3_FUSHE|nr:hypothetical protein FHETE_6816 [Fusarium heterosporum]